MDYLQHLKAPTEKKKKFYESHLQMVAWTGGPPLEVEGNN